MLINKQNAAEVKQQVLDTVSSLTLEDHTTAVNIVNSSIVNINTYSRNSILNGGPARR